MGFEILSSVLPSVINLVGKAFGIDMTSDENKLKAAEIELETQKLIAEQMKGQMLVNAEEARHQSIFVAGWRPFVGWVCGVSFAYHFLIQPLLVFIFASFEKFIDLPAFDMTTLTTVLMGMLGLGVLRTYEKTKLK